MGSDLASPRGVAFTTAFRFTQAKALLTLAGINLEKDSDLGAVETALKNATEARL